MKEKLVLAGLCNDLSSFVSSQGEIIHLPKVDQVTKGTKGEGAITWATDASDAGEETLNVDTHEYAAVLIEDVIKVQSNYDMMGLFATELGYSLANSVDSAIDTAIINSLKASGGGINQINVNATPMSVNADWDLIDPHTNKVVKTVPAKTLWVKLIQNRVETGEPYIMFKDTVDKALPEFQQKLGLKVRHSNLCSEITLATDEDRTAVCCLSSVNLEEYDEWKNDDLFIPDLIRMLDNVLDHFIHNAPPELHRAVYSARQERSLGLGAMGFHAYLQRHSIPFESVIAKIRNKNMFREIKEKANEATKLLAKERGECPDAVGHGVRNSHLLAIAPNASSSIICGNTSPSIEPYRANAFVQKTKTGSSLLKNEYLEHCLDEIGMNNAEIWQSIITHDGSVQHLEFLDQDTKDIFKTGVEMDQRWLVEFAADRQEHICQSQSLNLFFPANVSKQELHAVHMMAWKKGVKTLYYLRSEAIKRADNVSDEALRQYIFDSISDETCLACEG